MTIDLSDERNFNKAYLPLFRSDERYRIVYGGRDSGKSDFIAQWAIIALLTKPFFRMLLVRKYERSIMNSQFQTIVDYINLWKLRWEFKIKYSPLEIYCIKTGNFIRSRGLDNPDSALSTKDPNAAWYEEADQISLEAFLQTSASLRSSLTDEIYEWLTFNPRKKTSWINPMFFPSEHTYEREDGDFHWVNSIHPEATILHTTYKDNRYCKPTRVRLLESFKNYDDNYYKVNTLGLWGGALRGLIYPNFQVINAFPAGIDTVYGLDYGYNNPAALVRVGYDSDDLYLEEKFYGNSYSHINLVNYISNHFRNEIGKSLIVVDSAEPALIRTLKDAGFYVLPSQKNSGTIKTVYDGIMYTKQYNLKVVAGSENLMREFESYTWKTDKDGKIYDEPVKLEDHFMDAFRYVVQTYGVRHWRKKQFSVILSDKPKKIRQPKFVGF